MKLRPKNLSRQIDIWTVGHNLLFASPAFPARGILPRPGCQGPRKNKQQADASLALPIPDYPRGIGMSTGNWRVKPSDIIRVTKAVQSCGLHVRNVEVTGDGAIRVNVGEPDMARERSAIDNEWDEVFSENDGTH